MCTSHGYIVLNLKNGKKLLSVAFKKFKNTNWSVWPFLSKTDWYRLIFLILIHILVGMYLYCMVHIFYAYIDDIHMFRNRCSTGPVRIGETNWFKLVFKTMFMTWTWSALSQNPQNFMSCCIMLTGHVNFLLVLLRVPLAQAYCHSFCHLSALLHHLRAT